MAVGLVFTGSVGFGRPAKERASAQFAMPPALVPGETIAVADLLISAQKLLPKGAFLGPLLDEHYAVIDYEWLTQNFLPAYRTAVETVKATASREAEGSDCDNYGMFLRQMVGLAGIAGGSAEPAAAQAVVFQGKAFAGVGRTRERHAVGLLLTDRGWFVVEPQSATEPVAFERYVNRGGIHYITFH
jgi:hypothetical protein